MDFKEIETLVAKAKNEDNSAKELLVKEFRPFILNVSNKTFINGYDKQDIQNECYRILFKCVSVYNLEKHSINDLIKKSKNRSSMEGFEALTLSDNLEHTLPSNTSSLEDIFCMKADYKLLKYAFDSLNEAEKELIIFVFIKNNPLKSYAYWKNMCYSTATKKKKKILAKMREQLLAV